jgi:hypothetical protein
MNLSNSRVSAADGDSEFNRPDRVFFRSERLHYSYALLLEELGARIKKLRKERGLTLRDMVVQHGFHLTHWQAFERGKRGMALPSLLRIAEVLDVTLCDLLDGLGEAPKPPAE